MRAGTEQHIVLPDGIGEHLGLQEVQNIITGTLGRPGVRAVSVEQIAIGDDLPET